MNERGREFLKRKAQCNDTIARTRVMIRNDTDGAENLILAITLLIEDPSRFPAFDLHTQRAIIGMAGIGLQQTVGGVVEAELMEAGAL